MGNWSGDMFGFPMTKNAPFNAGGSRHVQQVWGSGSPASKAARKRSNMSEHKTDCTNTKNNIGEKKKNGLLTPGARNWGKMDCEKPQRNSGGLDNWGSDKGL